MKKFLSLSRLTGGFTMIELLIVISILGILAVVVLAALNPLEQINRGRDTSSRADAEQLISAVERYTANKGYYPWQENEDSANVLDAWTRVDDGSGGSTFVDDSTNTCPVLAKLAQGNANCAGSEELKSAYINRVADFATSRALYLYNRGSSSGDNTYVCFSPQSSEFTTQAGDRCASTQPTDIDVADWNEICLLNGVTQNPAGADVPMVCLP